MQLGLVLLLIRVYQIEASFGFLRLMPLVLGGFVVHAVLPRRWQLPFFVVLSLAGIGVVLGFPHNVGLVLLGLGLIGICHLPIAFGLRVGLLVAVGGLLATVRAGWIETHWDSLPRVVLPVLGAMFMFRLAIYLYDLRHEQTPASIWERLAYFFMLPNVCFLLFPVVDYQTFRRTYFNAEDTTIYQKGVLWMYRGVVHLLLYRLIYYHLTPAPSEVQTLGGVVQSMLTTYLLYLRISGQFHLIVGILCLFGFNLPETHHLYLLASSFNDYWRRINIYWKDFMMKLFYFPALVPLRRWGMTPAIVGATMVVFFGTWVLHSYQWFWLQGTFPITAPDALFWGILGGLVVLNSLYQAKQGRKRSLTKDETWSLRGAFVHSAKVVGMFVFITVLWSLWSSPTVTEWVALVAKAGRSDATSFGWLGLALVGLMLLGVGIQFLLSRGWQLTLVGSQPSFARSAWATSLGAIALLLMGSTGVQTQFGGQTAAVLASLQEERLNQYDQEQMERGYYEGLLNAESYTSALGASRNLQDWAGMFTSDATRPAEGVLVFELRPSYDGEFKGFPFRTNRWGMHDREYAQTKPPRTFRIAMLGSSYAMGTGVQADETFEALLEDRMNRQHVGEAYDRYEILNFSVGGYSVLQNVEVAHEKVPAFDPDMIFFIAHSTEYRRLRLNLRRIIRERQPVRYPYVRERLAQTGLTPEAADLDVEQQLAPHLNSILRWGIEEVASVFEERGIPLAFVLIPTSEEVDGADEERVARLARDARDAGFTVLRLDEAYRDADPSSIQLGDGDTHLNPLGHRMVAERFYEALVDNDDRLRLGLSTAPDRPLDAPSTPNPPN